MERELGKDLEQGKTRVAFLMDNCDAVEEKGYMKPFTPEELARMKESLSETRTSKLTTSRKKRRPR